jgi:hypothetical protein
MEKKLIKFNASFAYIYYLDNRKMRTEELLEAFAEELGYEIVQEGDGTELERKI